MDGKPIWIREFNRPAGTEIKHISGHWYLYERLSVYDKATKKKRKKSGRMLGTLTESGFQPSKRQSPLSHMAGENIENREYGATAFLYGMTGGMRRRLAEHFPDCWRELYAMAVMKCKEQAPFSRMEFCYNTSFLEQWLGPLSLSGARITELLRHVGADREGIRGYMKEDLPASGVIMFDGHRIISGSKTLEFAHVGYDSRRRFLPQVNLLYMFGVEGGRKLPVFYKQFAGDVPDVTAFSDIVADSGLKAEDVTVIADKGFCSGANDEMLEESSLGYILTVRRGCGGIGDLPDSPGGYEKAFTFRNRAIYCREYSTGAGEKTYLYYDMNLANDESADFIARREKANATAAIRKDAEDRRRARGKGRLSEEEYAALSPVDIAEELRAHKTTGTFMIKTNRTGLNCAQVYYLYKTRQDIEQAFKSYDDTLDAAASYMRNQYSFEAWLFVNHLALQMLYGVTQMIADCGLSDRYSFDDAMQFLKHVRANRINGTWRTTKVTKQTAKMCGDLGIEIGAPTPTRAP